MFTRGRLETKQLRTNEKNSSPETGIDLGLRSEVG